MLDDILTEAHKLTHADRNESYGPPIEDYWQVVNTFAVITGITLTPETAALFMVSVKLARLRHNLDKGIIHKDSLVDAAGYLWVFASIAEARGIYDIK